MEVSKRAVQAMQHVLEALDIDGTDENFRDTPTRFVKVLMHYFQPYNPKDDLSKQFNDSEGHAGNTYAHSLIVQTNIPYRALCAHHLMPVLGIAHVAYIPKQKVVGLSKLARLVYGISHREPSLQEHVGHAVADCLMKHLEAHGAMCVINAEHGCMSCRGVEEPGVATITSAIRGAFVENDAARSEVLQLIQMNCKS